ncbi:hypothetical protein [Mycobacterium sp. PSTR-4-N]|uniref:hypothetical protein n=1 Tax=Mycobacterium sp. PSTR-4-N TaxID=2917745 RepID=UPI001F14C7B4|nr:hypothetical protein [Mycobacterium sp. PSTR-4-N]MCG7592742.1 hypothetical protein [Mycobacterium sp. PSTR-4-N]
MAALAFGLGIAAAAVPWGLPSASASGLVVLGAPSDQYSVGFGTSRPATLSLNSLCANTITDIAWDSWGGQVAHATGTWCQSAGAISRGEPVRQVSLTATGLGLCQGRLGYRSLQYDSDAPMSICSAR